MRRLKECWKSLQVHRFRTLLSTLGILFGVAAFIAMMAIGTGAKVASLQEIEHLGIQNILIRKVDSSGKESRLPTLSLEDAEQLQALLGEEVVVAPVSRLTEVVEENPATLLGVTRSFFSIYDLSLFRGRPLSDHDVQKKERVVVLGSESARRLGLKSVVGSSLRLMGHDFLIVGQLGEKSDRDPSPLSTHSIDDSLLFPLSMEFFENQPGLSEIVVHVKDPEAISVMALLVKEIVERNHPQLQGIELIIPKELMRQKAATHSRFNALLASVAAISLLVGGIGIVNAMLASVFERMREIGVRRAIGATEREIWGQFLLEAVLISLGGALLGLIFGVMLSLGIEWSLGWKTVITLSSLFLSQVTALLVGIVSGLYPALVAARLDPVVVLRQAV